MSVDRFPENHHPFNHIINDHFDIADLYNSISFKLPYIHSGLHLFLFLLDTGILVLEKGLCPTSDETGQWSPV